MRKRERRKFLRKKMRSFVFCLTVSLDGFWGLLKVTKQEENIKRRKDEMKCQSFVDSNSMTWPSIL